MVGIEDFLRHVHAAPRAASVEELTRGAGFSTRTLYRWHRAIGNELRYFPVVDFSALGLLNVHLFVRNSRADWASLPYAIRGEWLLRSPGDRYVTAKAGSERPANRLRKEKLDMASLVVEGEGE